MKLSINEITTDGITLNCKLPPGVIEGFIPSWERGKNIQVLDALVISLNVYKSGSVVFARGESSLNVKLRCVRCGSWFNRSLDINVNSVLRPIQEMGSRSREEVRLKSSEMDFEFYTGNIIDIDELIAGNVFLATPDYPLCSETCKGLCPVCGKNLKEGKCNCDPGRVNQSVNPWVKILEQLKK